MIPAPALWTPRPSDPTIWSVLHRGMSLQVWIDIGEGSRRGAAQLSVWTPSCYGVTAGSPAWTAPEVAVECSRATPRDELIRRVVAALAMVWDEAAALRAVAAQREEWRQEVANG
jgi:predicted secreted Zn-dependent protease